MDFEVLHLCGGKSISQHCPFQQPNLRFSMKPNWNSFLFQTICLDCQPKPGLVLALASSENDSNTVQQNCCLHLFWEMGTMLWQHPSITGTRGTHQDTAPLPVPFESRQNNPILVHQDSGQTTSIVGHSSRVRDKYGFVAGYRYRPGGAVQTKVADASFERGKMATTK